MRSFVPQEWITVRSAGTTRVNQTTFKSQARGDGRV